MPEEGKWRARADLQDQGTDFCACNQSEYIRPRETADRCLVVGESCDGRRVSSLVAEHGTADGADSRTSPMAATADPVFKAMAAIGVANYADARQSCRMQPTSHGSGPGRAQSRREEEPKPSRARGVRQSSLPKARLISRRR